MELSKALFLLLAATIVSSAESTTTTSKNYRIAGGQYAEVAQFPHQVGIQTHRLSEHNWDYTTFCGGSLISDQFVLTAAHCLVGGVYVEIFLGATNFTGHWVRMQVEKENMIVHERYISANNDIRNDIGLVKLPRKAEFSNRVKTINLPRLSEQHRSFEKSVGWILGWGRLGDGEKAMSPSSLVYARRWILPASFCSYYYPIYEKNTQMCVDGSNGISACIGDSGGPVYIEEEDGSRTIVGIGSYEHIDGCEKHYPVAYTRVTAYLDWIVTNTGITLRE